MNHLPTVLIAHKTNRHAQKTVCHDGRREMKFVDWPTFQAPHLEWWRQARRCVSAAGLIFRSKGLRLAAVRPRQVVFCECPVALGSLT
jgi:hypothetical protein